MIEQLKPIVESQPYPLLFAVVSGAHMYGFPSPDSDYDLRGVFILPLRETAGLHEPKETIDVIERRDGIELDLVTHDVAKFFRLMLKRNGYVLEQLFSPLIVHTTPEHDELKAIAPKCMTKYHSHHYLGFVRTQWALFKKESPRRIKPLLYTYRVLLTGIHLVQTGKIETNLMTLNDKFNLPYIPELVERKVSGHEESSLDDIDTRFHKSEYKRLVSALEKARDASHLPDEPSAKDDLHDLLLRVRGVI